MLLSPILYYSATDMLLYDSHQNRFKRRFYSVMQNVIPVHVPEEEVLLDVLRIVWS